MDLSDFTCLNCSSGDNKSANTKYRGKRYGTINGKSDEKTSYLDRDGHPVSPQVIKIPRHDRAHPAPKTTSQISGSSEGDSRSNTYRRANYITKGNRDDIDDNVVSSVEFGTFSVQVYTRGKPVDDLEFLDDKEFGQYPEVLEPHPTAIFSRASMMSSTPYRDVVKEDEPEISEVQESVTNPGNIRSNFECSSVISQDEDTTITRTSTPAKDRKALMKFDHASCTRATLPGDRIKLDQAEIQTTSFSLPRSIRLSQTEDTLNPLPPQRLTKSPEPYVPELLFKETSFPSTSQTSPTDISPPLTPNRKRLVKKLLTKQTKTRKDFAQLYIASVQERRARYATENWDLSSINSSSNRSRRSVKSGISSNEVYSDRKWLDETEELISASNEATNEAMSREDYFKIVFFEESLRRRLQTQETFQLGEEVYTHVWHFICDTYRAVVSYVQVQE